MNETPDAIIVELAEALGRHRALTDRESILLERSLRRMIGPQRTFWTRSEDKKLRQLVARGLKRQQVAYAMGRSADAVSSRMRALGVYSANGRPDLRVEYAKRRLSKGPNAGQRKKG